MIESNLDYLICMLESLDDDRFGKLIRFIFDREDNKFINPYNTYKELFVNILLNNKDNIYKPIDNKTIEDFILLRDSYYWEVNSSEEAKNKIIHELKSNLIKKIDKYDKFYSEIYDDVFEGEYSTDDILNISDSDLKKYLYASFETVSLPIQDYKNFNPFVKYIDIILNSLKSFKISTEFLNKNFNFVIDDLIKRGMCYEYSNKNNEIRVHNLLPIKYNTCNIYSNNVYQLVESPNDNLKICKLFPIIQKRKHDIKIKGTYTICGEKLPLLGAKMQNSYINKLDSLTNAIKEIENLIYEQNLSEQGKAKKLNSRKDNICKMCLSETNIQDRTLQRCTICKRIINLIREEYNNKYNNNKIKYLIEYVPKDVIIENNGQLKMLHYKNLQDLLRNVNKTTPKNEKEIQTLIHRAFGDIS